jgi:HEPN domain-containing protein
MRPPEEIKTEFTRDWIRKAEIDFKTAGHLCQSGDEFVEGVAFHAQQAAEKYLKAFLVWHQIEFRKTHDIEALLMLAGKVDDKLPDVLRDAVVLTPYGVDYRYPGDYPEVTRGDAESAFQLADCVRKEVLGRLPRDVLE